MHKYHTNIQLQTLCHYLQSPQSDTPSNSYESLKTQEMQKVKEDWKIGDKSPYLKERKKVETEYKKQIDESKTKLTNLEKEILEKSRNRIKENREKRQEKIDVIKAIKKEGQLNTLRPKIIEEGIKIWPSELSDTSALKNLPIKKINGKITILRHNKQTTLEKDDQLLKDDILLTKNTEIIIEKKEEENNITKKLDSTKEKKYKNYTKIDRKNVQQALTDLGMNIGKIDGIIGKNTKSAIRLVQKRNNLVIDGIAGKNTIKALITELEKKIN